MALCPPRAPTAARSRSPQGIQEDCGSFLSWPWFGWALQVVVLASLAWAWATANVHNYKLSIWAVSARMLGSWTGSEGQRAVRHCKAPRGPIPIRSGGTMHPTLQAASVVIFTSCYTANKLFTMQP